MGVTGRLLSEQERGEKIRYVVVHLVAFMSLGLSLTISEAKNLNDRFGHSKRGAYDM